MKQEDKLNFYKKLLEKTLDVNSKILSDCYWRPTMSPETLSELEALVSAIQEELNTGSV